jgi:hypothetical protein
MVIPCHAMQASATYASAGLSKGAAYFTPAEATATPVVVSASLKNRQESRRCVNSLCTLSLQHATAVHITDLTKRLL